MTRFSGSALYLAWEHSAGTVELMADYRAFDWTPTLALVDASAGADSFRNYLPGTGEGGDIALSMIAPVNGTLLPDVLELGARGTLHYAPEGTAIGKPRYYIPAISRGIAYSEPYDDIVECNVGFQQSSASTHYTEIGVPAGWTMTVPFNVERTEAGLYRPAPAFNLRDHANITIAKTYYVKKGGNDGADGLTWATALAKPATAWLKADADQVIIEAGYYFRSECTGFVTRSMEILAYGGTVYITNDCRDNLGAFSPVDSHYEATLSTAQTLYLLEDAANPDAFGHPTQLVKQTSIAEVDATVNTWWQDGLNVYIHTADARAPDTDIAYYNNEYVGGAIADGITVYYEGISFKGGAVLFRCAATSGDPSTEIYLQDCSSYNWTVAGVDEMISVDCNVFNGDGDGWNYDARGSVITNAIEIDCEGWNLGTGSTHQASTIHNGCQIVRINGDYHHTAGQNVAEADATCKAWMLGCEFYNSASGVGYYGGNAWMDGCYIHDNATDIQTASSSTVYIRNLISGGVFTGDGTVTGY